MKRVVVVVSSRDRMCFTGNDLVVIDTDSVSSVSKLIIKRRHEKEALAVFSMWQYWFREEDKTLDKADEYDTETGEANQTDQDEFSPEKDAERRIIEKKTYGGQIPD